MDNRGNSLYHIHTRRHADSPVEVKLNTPHLRPQQQLCAVVLFIQCYSHDPCGNESMIPKVHQTSAELPQLCSKIPFRCSNPIKPNNIHTTLPFTETRSNTFKAFPIAYSLKDGRTRSQTVVILEPPKKKTSFSVRATPSNKVSNFELVVLLGAVVCRPRLPR